MSRLAAIATHEAAHAAAAVLLGCKVTLVTVTSAEDGVVGETHWIRGPLTRIHLLIMLAGGLVADTSIATEYGCWPPEWPTLPGRGDQGDIHEAVKRLELDKADYDQVVRGARELVASQEFRHLTLMVSAAAGPDRPMNGDDVERVAGTDLISRYQRS